MRLELHSHNSLMRGRVRFLILAITLPLLQTSVVISDDLLGPSVSLWLENDAVLNTDRHYTHGTRLEYLSAETPAIAGNRIGSIGLGLPELGMDVQALRWGVRLGQNLYTPADLHESSPQPEDRPYAAWLFCAMTLQRRGETFGNIPTLDSVALDAGVVGPAALGKELQDFVHRVDAAGWAYQLRNEPAVDVEGARIWKFSSGDHQGWSLQFLPQMGVRLGTLQVEGSVGAQSRAGYAIPRDFGRHTLDDATPETGGFSPNRSNSFHVYLLVGAEAKVVGWNMLLDGNIWHDSPSVHKEPVVADFTAGIVVGWKHFEVAYIHVFRTQEFQRQSEVDSFGSLALSWHP